MRSARGIATLVLAVAIATGCTDTTKPAVAVNEPAIAPQQTSARYTESGPQAAPPGVGPQWAAATSIIVEAAAGFRSEAVNPDEGVAGNARNYAWGQSIVRYNANEADADVDLTVRKNGMLVGSAQGHQSDRYLFAANRSVSAITQAAVAAACGHTAQAKAAGEVWNKALVPPTFWMEWGRKAGSDTESAYQSPCPAGLPGSSGGGTPPPDETNGRCPWHRNYVIYTDGTWDWSTPWYHACAGDELALTPGGPTEIAPGRSASLSSMLGAKGGGAPMRLTLVGTTRPSNGQVTTIQRDSRTNADAIITVDVTRATAADIEEAFVAAETVSLKVKPKDVRSAYGRVVSSPSAPARAASGEGSRAAKNLSALLRAAGRGKSDGDGARVDVVVDRK